MRCTVQTSLLADALEFVNGHLGKDDKVILTICTSADGPSTLRVHSSGVTKSYAEQHLPIEHVDETGHVCVSARPLVDLLRTLFDAEVYLATDHQALRVEHALDASRFTVVSYRAFTQVVTDDVIADPPQTIARIPSAAWARALQAARPCLRISDSTPWGHTALVAIADTPGATSEVGVVSTDGRIMALVNPAALASPSARIIVNASTLEATSALADVADEPDSMIEIGIGTRYVTFRGKGRLIADRPVVVAFPPFERFLALIPPAERCFDLYRDDVRKAVSFLQKSATEDVARIWWMLRDSGKVRFATEESFVDVDPTAPVNAAVGTMSLPVQMGYLKRAIASQSPSLKFSLPPTDGAFTPFVVVSIDGAVVIQPLTVKHTDAQLKKTA